MPANQSSDFNPHPYFAGGWGEVPAYPPPLYVPPPRPPTPQEQQAINAAIAVLQSHDISSLQRIGTSLNNRVWMIAPSLTWPADPNTLFEMGYTVPHSKPNTIYLSGDLFNQGAPNSFLPSQNGDQETSNQLLYTMVHENAHLNSMNSADYPGQWYDYWFDDGVHDWIQDYVEQIGEIMNKNRKKHKDPICGGK
jgi:hypothetical protein